MKYRIHLTAIADTEELNITEEQLKESFFDCFYVPCNDLYDERSKVDLDSESYCVSPVDTSNKILDDVRLPMIKALIDSHEQNTSLDRVYSVADYAIEDIKKAFGLVSE